MNDPNQTIKFLQNYFDSTELKIISEAVEHYSRVLTGRALHEKCRQIKTIFELSSKGAI